MALYIEWELRKKSATVGGDMRIEKLTPEQAACESRSRTSSPSVPRDRGLATSSDSRRATSISRWSSVTRPASPRPGTSATTLRAFCLTG
jgi:hypothetical protein